MKIDLDHQTGCVWDATTSSGQQVIVLVVEPTPFDGRRQRYVCLTLYNDTGLNFPVGGLRIWPLGGEPWKRVA
jgi:hypothetical protein